MNGTIAVELCNVRQIACARFPEWTSTSQIRDLVGRLADGTIPATFNILLDFTTTQFIELPGMDALDIAMKRRRGLPEFTPTPVRTAMIGLKPSINDVLDLWQSFLTEDPPVIVFQRFDSEADALEWIVQTRQG
ncbi:MAG: hypothetical protein ACQRW7_06035 [Caulobacterales bacterium]|uniref:hypothetical protein n=1 Tax=Glycocaulis sp. TaxID=1969725 RepID=UPI003FA10603